MAKRKTTPEPSAPAVDLTPRRVTNLAQVEDREPVIVDYPHNGQILRFTGRRLTPRELRPLSTLVDSVLPPLKPADKEHEEAWFDQRDPEYLRQRAEAQRQCRAMVLWLSFPVFREAAEAEARERELPSASAPPLSPDSSGSGVNAAHRPQSAVEIADWLDDRPIDETLYQYLYLRVTGQIDYNPALTVEAVNFTSGGTNPPG